MAAETLFGVLQTMVIRLPSFAVGAVGLWLAFTRRHEHPRVSKFAMVGFGAMLLSAFSFVGLQLWIQYAIANGEGPGVLGIASRWNFVGYPLSLISLTATCVAVFIDRRPSANRTRSDEFAGAA